MNLFNEQEEIFLQKLPNGIFDMDKEIFSIGREIKKRLGDDGYLIENNLSIILIGISRNNIQDAFYDNEHAFGELYSLMWKVSKSTERDDNDIQKQKLYPEIKKYCDMYKTKYKSSYTANSMALIAVIPLTIKKIYKEIRVWYSSEGRIDTVRLKELYEEMSSYTCSKLLDQMNELIKNRFVITPALNVYMQAVTDNYLNFLLERDDVTSKQLFQLLLDEEEV